MAVRGGIAVHEGKGLLVLIQADGRNLSGNDPTKDTMGFGLAFRHFTTSFPEERGITDPFFELFNNPVQAGPGKAASTRGDERVFKQRH
jgi:hypothetical protein